MLFSHSGEPLVQISSAEHVAPISTVVVSPQAWQLARAYCSGSVLPSQNVIVTEMHEVPVAPPPLPIVYPLTEAVQVTLFHVCLFFVPFSSSSSSCRMLVGFLL